MPDFECGCDASKQAEELHTELGRRWTAIEQAEQIATELLAETAWIYVVSLPKFSPQLYNKVYNLRTTLRQALQKEEK